MDVQTQATIEAGLQVAGALAPALAATGPQGAAVAALAPVALTFLQAAITLQQANAMSEVDLATLFAKVGAGIASSHAQWAAMDAAEVKTA